MAEIVKTTKRLPVQRFEDVTVYQLTLDEVELRRVAICLARGEIGHPRVLDSIPSDMREWAVRLTIQERDTYLLDHPAKGATTRLDLLVAEG